MHGWYGLGGLVRIYSIEEEVNTHVQYRECGGWVYICISGGLNASMWVWRGVTIYMCACIPVTAGSGLSARHNYI
jgi:hypothetical protein